MLHGTRGCEQSSPHAADLDSPGVRAGAPLAFEHRGPRRWSVEPSATSRQHAGVRSIIFVSMVLCGNSRRTSQVPSNAARRSAVTPCGRKHGLAGASLTGFARSRTRLISTQRFFRIVSGCRASDATARTSGGSHPVPRDRHGTCSRVPVQP